ncbi:hypothetical protein BH24PSE2_BH24PSE2_15680 [soil metagenome]
MIRWILMGVCGACGTATGGTPDLELGAELELEYVVPDGGRGSFFQMDQLYLIPQVRLQPNLLLSADIAVKEEETIAEEVWLRYSGLPGQSWIEVGLNDPLIAEIDRKSEAEILLETAFYRSDELGIRGGGKLADIGYWWLSASNGFVLEGKQPSEEAVFPLVADGRATTATGGRRLYGAGIGARGALAGRIALDLMPFVYRGRLSADDRRLLATIPGVADGGDTKERAGINVSAAFGRVTVVGQWLHARDSRFERDGWFVQPSIDVPAGTLGELTLVYRFNDIDVHVPPEPNASFTWGRRQHVFAVIGALSDNVRLKLERYLNHEATGAASVDNDEYLIQLEAGF